MHACPCCGKPRRIAHLLELYERNYRLIQRLVPEPDAPCHRAVSHSLSDCPLHLEIVERDRYTLTLRLTYEFTDESGIRRQPDLWVRLYRDAGVAEALACNHRPPWLAERDGDPAAHAFLSAQWRRNLLLNKWLEYLLDHGHGFIASARPRAMEPA
ncbi:Protein of unknown function [Fontimonas thermophila]|uniref:DUF1249 domain-containing protein n=2 Tax=Fontimonas thermophila TaxID=1076937 RepID=A0A1I2HTZ6_9GAMM|nr:Protein of unknown function [Fontimonas thermophila]